METTRFQNDQPIDVGTLAMLFIAGYAVGSGRWKMLLGPGSTIFRQLGNVAYDEALKHFREYKNTRSDTRNNDEGTGLKSIAQNYAASHPTSG